MSAKKRNSNLGEISSTKKTLNKMYKSGQIVYINENGRCRIVRHYLKHMTEGIDNILNVNIEKEYKVLQREANISEELEELNVNIMEKLKNQRNHTEAVALHTLNRCKSLCQQIGQPVKHVEELRLTENSIMHLLEDLNK